MKYIFSCLLLSVMTTFCFAQKDSNFTIIIDGKSIPINLNEEKEYKDSKGDIVKIRLEQPDVLTYKDDVVTFKHNKNLSVSNTEVENGVEQCVGMESTGNGFLIQKYTNFNPTSLNDIMLNEITKESVSYGYKMTEKKFKHKLKSGETIEGTEATLTYKGEKEVYTVASYGEKDEGILIILMNIYQDGTYSEIIDLLLKSLELR